MCPETQEEGFGSRVLRRIERDMYLLWEERGMERMPRVVRLHPTLYHAIHREMIDRFTEGYHVIALMENYRRLDSPTVRTLYGDFWFIEDGDLPKGEYLFDHYSVWKARNEREAALREYAHHLQRRLDGREP